MKKNINKLLVGLAMIGLFAVNLAQTGSLLVEASRNNPNDEAITLEMSAEKIAKGETVQVELTDNQQALATILSRDTMGVDGSTSNGEQPLFLTIPDGLVLQTDLISQQNQKEGMSISLTERPNEYRIDWSEERQQTKLKLSILATDEGLFKITAEKKRHNERVAMTRTELSVKGESTELLATSTDLTESINEPVTRASQAISNETEFRQALTNTAGVEYHLAANVNLGFVSPNNSNITVTTNKQIDLNGFSLHFGIGGNASNGRILLKGYENFTEFKLFDSSHGRVGQITSAFTYGNGITGGIIYDGYTGGANQLGANGLNKNLKVILQDLNVTSDSFLNVYFAKGVVMKGKVDIHVNRKGIKASNITAYGDSTDPNNPENAVVESSTTNTGGSGAFAQDNGALNFALGYQWLNNAGSRNDERKFWVQKNATVNATSKSQDTAYGNIVANYRSIVIDGRFNATADRSPVLRSIGSEPSASTNAQIYFNKGSSTRLYTTYTGNSYGVVYTYKMDIHIDSPEIFDLRYYGRGASFFYAYASGGRSTIEVKNMDNAIWDANSYGVGNPAYLWQKVTNFKITNLATDNNYVIESTDPTLTKAKFNLNASSRWSNDVLLPNITIDEAEVVSGSYVVPNNKKGLSGSTDYIEPNGNHIVKPATGAKVTLKLGTTTYQTTVNGEGNWGFPNLDLTAYKGGTTGSLTLVDLDERTASANLAIIDKQPPKARAVAQKTNLNSTSGIPAVAKEAVTDLSDETTAVANLQIQWLTSAAEKAEMVKSIGLKILKVSVKDEASNETVVEVPLLVIDETTVDTPTGAVSGIDFSSTTKEFSGDQRRGIVLEKGKAKGYEKASDRIVDVTNDEAKFIVDFTKVGTDTGKKYPITLRVADATKTIYVTFADEKGPTAKSKVTPIKQDDQAAINAGDLKTFVRDLEDDVSAVADIKAELVAGQNVANLVGTVGPKELKIKFSDEAGNSTIVTTSLFIYDETFEVGDGVLLKGSDMRMAKSDWLGNQRELVIEQGKVEAYDISGEKPVNITNDKTKFDIFTDQVSTDEEVDYPVILHSNGTSKIIMLTFSESVTKVKLSVNHFLFGTDEEIYEDALRTTAKKQPDIYEATAGESLSETLANLDMILAYDGYTRVLEPPYEVSDNQGAVSDTVPKTDFSVTYYYTGELAIEEATAVEFGTIDLNNANVKRYQPINTPKVDVMDTRKISSEDNWTLQLAQGIPLADKKQSLFIGELLFVDRQGSEKIISKTSESVVLGTNERPLTVVNMTTAGKKEGLYLRQGMGNYARSYHGTLKWSLIDGPSLP